MSDEFIQSPVGGAKLYPVQGCTGYRLKTPIYVLSVLVASLRQYFGSPGRIPSEISSYVWDPDHAKSNLWISEDYNADRAVVGKRPSVLVSLDNQSYPQQAIGDYMAHDMANSTTYMFNVIDATARYRCISENMLSSVELATEVRYFISGFRHQLEKAFCLDKLRVAQVGRTQKIEEYKEYWVTDVMAELKYQESWGVTTENLKIKSIYTDLRITEAAKNILPQQFFG